MATFAKSTFNAAVYSSFRPTYPRRLFTDIFEYHRQNANGEKPLWDVAVDLGCGTGQATSQLAGTFSNVIGIDPSGPMVEKARKSVVKTPQDDAQYQFYQGSSEKLSMLKDESVDLVISAQAGHWFDWSKVWPELNRVLRKGGSAAIWTYGEFRLPQYPTTDSLITAYAQGKDPKTSVGPHFERPGRTILEDMLVDVPAPSTYVDGLAQFERRFYSGANFPPHLPQPKPEQVFPVILSKTMRWRDLMGYFRTWSALQNYHEQHPDDLKSADERFPEDMNTVTEDGDVNVSGGDIAIRFWKDLRQEAKKHGGSYHVDEKVEVEWPIALLLAKKA